MEKPTLHDEVSSPGRRHFRFGLRGMLAFVVLFAFLFGGIAREERRVRQEARLLADLTVVGVRVDLQEPTTLLLWVSKHMPRWESSLVNGVGKGWLSYPTTFTCTNIRDEQVPYIAERLQRVGTVRELVYTLGPLTEEGAARLRSGLPGVIVAPRDRRDLQTYSLSQYRREHFAFGVFLLDVSLAVGLLVVGGLVVISILRRFRRSQAA